MTMEAGDKAVRRVDAPGRQDKQGGKPKCWTLQFVWLLIAILNPVAQAWVFGGIDGWMDGRRAWGRGRLGGGCGRFDNHP